MAAESSALAASEQGSVAICAAELLGGLGGLRARLGRARQGFEDLHGLCSKERGHLKKKVAFCRGHLSVRASNRDGACVEAVAAHRGKEDECNVLSIPASTAACAYTAVASELCQSYSGCLWGGSSDAPAVQRCAKVLADDLEGDTAALAAQAAAELHRCRAGQSNASTCEALKEAPAEALCAGHSVDAAAWQPPPVTWDIDKALVRLSPHDVDGLALHVRCASPDAHVTLDANSRAAHGSVGLVLEGSGQTLNWNASGIHGWPVRSRDHWTGPSPAVALKGLTTRLTLRSPAVALELQGLRLDPPSCKIEAAVLPGASLSSDGAGAEVPGGFIPWRIDPMELALRYRERMLVEVMGVSANPFFLMLCLTAVGLFAIVGFVVQFVGSLSKTSQARQRS